MTHEDNYPQCNGLCNQGRKLCPTPQACFLPEVEEGDEPSIDWAFVGTCVAVILACIAGLVWILLRAQW